MTIAPRPLLEGIGKMLVTSAHHRFETATDPEGRAWKPLAASTIKARQKRLTTRSKRGIAASAMAALSGKTGNEPRFVTGRSEQSITYHATETSLDVGSNYKFPGGAKSALAIHELSGDAGRGALGDDSGASVSWRQSRRRSRNGRTRRTLFREHLMGAVVLPFPRQGVQYSPPIPLDIATVENAILARLANAFGGSIVNGKVTGAAVDIDHYPERASESYRLTHRVGAVLVRFNGSEYGPVIDTEAVIQERTFKWFVAILMRDLGWSYGGQASGPSPGAYQVVETVRLALSGFKVLGFRKMYPANEEHEGRDKEGGVYYHNAIYRHVTMALEQSTAPNHPILVKAQAFEEGAQTTIQVPIAPLTFTGAAPGAIQLPQINVSNVVVLSDDLSTEYAAGTDYTVDPVAGIVARIATGNIGAGATVQIGFNYADSVTSLAGGGAAPLQPNN